MSRITIFSLNTNNIDEKLFFFDLPLSLEADISFILTHFFYLNYFSSKAQ